MPSILIIDDDARHRKVVRHLIEKLNPHVEVEEFDSSASGDIRELTAIGRYALIILDTTVAGQDAIAWMQRVIKQQEEAPAFIFLSSITDIQSVDTTQLLVAAIKGGAINFFFKKKLDMKRLTREITDIIGVAEKRETKAAATKSKPEPTPVKQGEVEDTMTEIGLAMTMMHGNKKWPFSTEDILQGKAYLGHYKITSYLGEDSVASSFVATASGLKTSVVVKLVNQLRLSGSAIPASFVEKFDAIKKLHHPNVLHLFNYEIVNKRIVVGIEYLRGGTLEERLKKGKLEQREAIQYFRQLLSGMSSLHDIGLELHEVMPKQLMFRDQNTLVITHLGLLNELHGLSEITGEWTMPQISPVYTSPETVQSHISDKRSDIYLAGIIGFEMLSGKPPYSDGSTQDILYAHAAEPVPHLPDPRHPLNDLLMSMLTKMPEKRIQSAGEALRRLNKIYPAQ